MSYDFNEERSYFIRKSVFPHPFVESIDEGEPFRCLEEWNIIFISQAIREKPEWKRKYKDPTIVAKWKAELEQQFVDKSSAFERVWKYVLRELAWYEYVEHTFPGLEEKGFKIGCDHKIIYSDQAVPEELKDQLRKAVETFTLEEFPDGLDYHPGSDGKVVDLVHPSLYPLQYGVTPMYKAPESGNLITAVFDPAEVPFKSGVQPWAISKKYQWLPALMRWGWKNRCNQYSFASYINNLHPKHESLYLAIEKVFNLALPGLDYVLSRYLSPEVLRVPIGELYTDEWKKIDREYIDRAYKDNALWDSYDEHDAKKADYMKELPLDYTRDPPVNYTFQLSKKFLTLKVIVKLANIELSPEKPTYDGGSWHVEGMANEDIVSTVLYYYDSENITESRLSFKASFEDPEYDQGDSIGLSKIYGLKDGDQMSKIIGDVVCQEDRVVIFPNGLQHHVDPFELKDKSKNGHRKILCFFLIDPYNKGVISTAQVPPQQPLWHQLYKEQEPEIEKFLQEENEKVKENRYYRTPEKWNMFKYLGPEWRKQVELMMKNSPEKRSWPETMEVAKEIRKSLMEERKAPDDPDVDLAFTRGFAMCEH